MTFGVRSGLRHPQRLTVGAIASETFYTAFYVLLAARAAPSGTGRESLPAEPCPQPDR